MWLYRIATNRCLNAIRDAERPLVAVPVPPSEPPPSRHDAVTWLQPCPDAWLDDPAMAPPARVETHETVGLAFVAALALLPPRQTAAFVLGDVLGFPVTEVAVMLGVTPTAAKGLRQRARHALRQRGALAEGRVVADAGTGVTPAGGPGAPAELVRRFVDAFADDDVVDMLTDDAWLRMPPAPHEYRGRPAIAAFLRASAAGRAGRRLGLLPTRANGQPAFTCFLPTSASSRRRREEGRSSPPVSSCSTWSAAPSPASRGSSIRACRLSSSAPGRRARAARALAGVWSGRILNRLPRPAEVGQAPSAVRSVTSSVWGTTNCREHRQEARGGSTARIQPDVW